MEKYNTKIKEFDDTFEQEFSSMLKPKNTNNIHTDENLSDAYENTEMKRVSSSISSNLTDNYFSDTN